MNITHKTSFFLVLSLFLFVPALAQEEVDPPFSDTPPTFTAHLITDMHSANFVVPIDLNEDDYIDLVLSGSKGDGTIRWYKNTDGKGNFTVHHIYNNAVSATNAIAIADIDGDLDLDIASASGRDDTIRWHQNDGNENFSAVSIFSSASSFPVSVAIADMTGDMNLDVVSASSGDDSVRWHRNFGMGNFTLLGVSENDLIFGDADNINSVATADFDGDGDNDVVSASIWDNRIRWYENAGAEGFLCTKVIFNEAVEARNVVAVDLDEDEDIDVLSTSGSTLYWYKNDGFGNFEVFEIFDSANGLRSVAVADLDNDNDLDVLSSSIGDDTIRWHENNGEEKFKTHIIADWDGTTNPISTAAADIDGDGDMDVIVPDTGSNSIYWFENSHITLTDMPSAFPETTTLYPNPTTRTLYISYTTDTTTTYELIDIAGKLLEVIHKSGQEHQIDVSHLSQGNYLLKATSGSETTYYRFVKEE